MHHEDARVVRDHDVLAPAVREERAHVAAQEVGREALLRARGVHVRGDEVEGVAVQMKRVLATIGVVPATDSDRAGGAALASRSSL